ncbi:hypothetical protein AA101099_2275 [Neoasaia chiangmaiensis NBRC 101099]|uniref:Uncharacterized protein n=1 Tax=Neoasaia chiangmaiensis TaxID=320497 RepID=A0A1U9KSH8_9PROT|nr:hypothetical protein [Neoasaia chiangmaiensis]AQS88776.1 hypothetical protein A0U93_13540 [Neoasaia chiangmaiensis]GBR40791.1 hypothetical protein AA101099_2275 [Neoasaia chiangmaiensis NBRC 101099]GEN13736.1 hypothetical protein NCH01_01670 [Neoasaia chiangmaiensis]
MPVIVYQSFNSAGSKVVGGSSNYAKLVAQRFTRDANKYAVDNGHNALVMPETTPVPSGPLQGPANLVPVTALPSGNNPSLNECAQPRSLMGSHVNQIWQHCSREIGQQAPAILVCGELHDPAEASGGALVALPDKVRRVVSEPSRAGKYLNNQAFTCFSDKGPLVEFLASGNGYVVYRLHDLLIAFVHVPNEISKDNQKTISFYREISRNIQGRPLDVVIGDTNQKGQNFTARALQELYGGTRTYENAIDPAHINTVDTLIGPRNGPYRGDGRSGTNAKATEAFDVAVYCRETVSCPRGFYISQSSTGTTASDHLGICVEVERASTKPTLKRKFGDVAPQAATDPNLGPVSKRGKFSLDTHQ